jgi:5'-methylthioadenosine phosphorylase
MNKVGLILGTGIQKLHLDDHRSTTTKGTGVPLETGTVGGCPVVILNRQWGHTPPHAVDHERNLRALRASCDFVIATTSVGSLNRRYEPGTFAIPYDYVDFSGSLKSTITTIRHPVANQPFSPLITRALDNAFAQTQRHPSHPPVLLTISGPRFSTQAESRFYAKQDWSLINMTTGPETTVALELGLPYAVLCTITDYDHAARHAGDPVTTLELVRERAAQANEVLAEVLPLAIRSLALSYR